MDKKPLLAKYKSSSKELNQILNEWDFIGVLPFEGWPKDEYDCLVGPILSLLSKGSDSKEVSKYLQQELKDHFGFTDYPQEKTIKIAETIVKWWTVKNPKLTR